MAPAPLAQPTFLPPWSPSGLDALRRTLRERERPWDLVVVGAGITGAGVARDAAIRGMEVLVLEARDVAFGTSSRSTRLVHGGVRYLERGEVGLVYEALRERARLYRAAGHLVRPATFLFPAYRGDRLGPWKLRLGLTLYDTLNFHRGTPHAFMSPEACLAQEPMLAGPNLLGGVAYEDAVTDDARLTLAVLQDARRHGAQVLTYAPVDRIEPHEPGALQSVLLADGTRVATRQTVVATGPWTGRRLLGAQADNLLSLSKGVHLVMRTQDVPVRQPLVVQAPGHSRIVFVIPWGTRTYLGTTDDPYVGDPALAGVTEADENAVLDVIGRILPGAALRTEGIVSAWSGVRPLVRPEDSGNSPTAEISRRHRIIINEHGVIGLVGGKLTTFRSMAQELVDEVARRLASRHDRTFRPCRTHVIPICPGEPISCEERSQRPLLGDLEPRHGPRARDLADRVRERPDLGERLVDDLPYRWCEVEEAIEHEGALHLSDILRRRLPLVLTDPRLGGGVAEDIARRLVDARGGSASDVAEELERFAEQVHTETRRTPIQ